VLIAEGKVVAIGGPDLAIPAGYTRIDGSGKFVTPG
jgi:imidazolonepropionase-like amidohydrolase